MRQKNIFLLLFFVAGCLNGRIARADTLNFAEVIRYVAAHHPAILAAQAELRAADEQFAEAQSGWRPSLSAEGDAGWTTIKDTAFSSQQTHGITKGGNVILDQPLYRGGKTTAEMNRARHSILAARAHYNETVQETLLRAGTAYADLARDRLLLSLNQENAARLQNEVTAAQERFHGGDATVGDVDQAQSRAARSNADAIRARESVLAAQAIYTRAVGLPAVDTLILPPSMFHFPDSAAGVANDALAANPNLIAAQQQAAAAAEDVKSGYGDLRPQLSAFASYDNQYQPQYGVVDHASSAATGVRVRLALYDGGLSRARLRTQKDNVAQRRWDMDDITAAVHADALRQWQDWQAQSALIDAANQELQAAQAASAAVSAEAHIGTRPVIDVLDADQDLLTAQGNLAGAQHDEFVDALNLAVTLGQLLPQNMGMNDVAYDPVPHLRATADKLFTFNPD